MTESQIVARLKVLEDYEMSIIRNSRDGLDDPEAEDRELLKILRARRKLSNALSKARGETP